MTPSLPPELLAEILARATEGRAGRAAENKEQVAAGVPRVGRVARLLERGFRGWGTRDRSVEGSARGAERGRLRGRIRSVVLDRTGPNPIPEGVDGLDLLPGLLTCFTSAERVELSTDGLGGRFGDGGGMEPALVRALAQLANVRHFNLTSPAHHRDVVVPWCEHLDQLAGAWPRLESVQLHAIGWVDSRQVPRPGLLAALHSHVSLRSFMLANATSYSSLEAILTSLPPTATSLALRDINLFSDETCLSQIFQAQLPLLASAVSELTLIAGVEDDVGPWPASYDRPYDAAFTQLVNLRRLAISPSALEDLPAALGSLPSLEELHLQVGRLAMPAPPGGEDVAELLRRARALRRVAICPETCEGWRDEERGAVEEAAKAEAVELVWLGAGELL